MPPLGENARAKACQTPPCLRHPQKPIIPSGCKTSSRAFTESKSADEPTGLQAPAGSIPGAIPHPFASPDFGLNKASIVAIPPQHIASKLPFPYLAPRWELASSRRASRTSNPLRNIVDNLKPDPEHPSPVLNFALGDPTAYALEGHLRCPDVLIDAVAKHVEEGLHNGYACSAGTLEARQALAAAYSYPGRKLLTAEDVIIASGASGALEIVLTALLDEGDAVLIPRPGFALYQVLARSLGAEAVPYDLVHEDNWAIDLAALDATIAGYNNGQTVGNGGGAGLQGDVRGMPGSMRSDGPSTSRTLPARIKAIMVNNPSNPCGNVLSKENLLGLLDVARRHSLPIVADEIYGRLVFPGESFHPLGALTTDVPVLTVGGMAKQFAVPGWRVGWLLLHDPLGALDGPGEEETCDHPQQRRASLRRGLENLTQLVLGANTLAQSTIPLLFSSKFGPRLEAFYANYVSILVDNANFIKATLLPVAEGMEGKEGIWGVTLSNFPQGALYLLLKLSLDKFIDLPDDVAFCAALLKEENLVLLPGQCFGIPGYVRLVLTPPRPALVEGLDRLRTFCFRHALVTKAEEARPLLPMGCHDKIAK
ncbi:hypothetical protein NSK_002773 [Nannochloropsis salina CCMP1776]|uniref:Aminotransferase class I/classII large domain-containing protein n=1 Tax=Nannochloropsis salina CCMP1776 TaxID=1027361 RepID=A0A4D9D7G5_9STRA|nr:hypothetical protein NSK_002773 [Nannochloropsis salina CCMP1776]|eukprot:TFJ85953.1 hypothetical protein NSK_002773 [Nannochloropsis salina CCMP1776]